MQIGATSRVHRILEGEVLFEESVEVVPRTAGRDEGSEPPRRHIALLNGLRGALPKRPV